MTDWTDLSLDIYPDMQKMDFLPCPEVTRLSESGERSLQVSEVRFATHVGTHFDAACHAIPDGHTIDEYDLDRWITDGIVHGVDARPRSPIGVEDVADCADRLEPGDALLLSTGWERRIDDDSYADHPYFSDELANWLVEREVNWVGMDVLTPDRPPALRDEDFGFPVHNRLLGNDVLIAENLTNLTQLVGSRVSLVALPLPVRDVDGAPARIVAREATDR